MGEIASVITVKDQASSARASNQSKQARHIKQLANILFEYYLCEGPVDLLVAVTQLYQAHLDLAVIAHMPDIPTALMHMAEVFFAKHELTYDLPALQGSIRYYERALSHPELRPPHCRRIKVGLAHALHHRFRALTSYKDCKTAVNMIDECLEDTHNGDDVSQTWALIVRILMWTNPYTGLAATSMPLENMQSMLLNLRNKPRMILPRSKYLLSLVAEATLSGVLFARKSRCLDHINEGLETATRARNLCSESAEVMYYQVSSALAFVYANGRRESAEKYHPRLDAAAELTAQIRSTSYLSVLTRSEALSHWAMMSFIRGAQHTDLDAMERALSANKAALSICPQSHILQFTLVSNLASMSGTYFEYSGRLSILDEIVTLQELYHDQIARGPSWLAISMAEVMLMRARISAPDAAGFYVSRAIEMCHHRRSAPDDLDMYAADEEEQIALTLPIIHASRIQLQLGQQPLLDVNAISQLAHQALHAQYFLEPTARVTCVLAQSESLVSQARNLGDLSLLSEAEILLDEEVLLYQRNWPSTFNQLVDLIAAQADVRVVQTDLRSPGPIKPFSNEAGELYHRAATVTTGQPLERFRVCLRWGAYAAERGVMIEAFRAYSLAMEILPNVVFRGEDVLGRMEALRQINGFAASSVATALTMGNISAAVEFLEATRGILWLQSVQTRSSSFMNLPGSLQERVRNANLELQMADRVDWTTRRKKSQELQVIIEEIRASPGNDRFLLPPLLEEIHEALRSRRGLAVVVIPSSSCCDVVVFGVVQGPCHLRLPALNMKHIQELAKDFGALCTATRAAHEAQCRAMKKIKLDLEQSRPSIPTGAELLSELWVNLVYPVIKFLHMKVVDPELRPRLWWCPIASLSLLPLHAAGVYQHPSQDCVSNYVVSSSTPTLSALYRQLTEVAAKSDIEGVAVPSMLLAAQPESVGHASLPNAIREIECVQNLVPREVPLHITDTQGITVDVALNRIAHVHLLHLACHGHQDQENPLNSGFELQDGRLTLGQLMHLNTPNAQLAYLSACETAGLDESRPDEGLNLAGTMIFVGFKSVIGTLWAMNDIDGPFVAERIYQRIFKDGRLDLSAVPYAVDNAVRELRESGVSATRCATYVHFGV